MYAWIFVNKYKKIDTDNARKILHLPGFHNLFVAPDFKGYTSEIPENYDKDNLLFNCFGFIEETLKRWYTRYKDDYQSNQRRSRYLHSPTTIIKLKQALEETNIQTKSFGFTWKPQNVTFLDSLPNL